MFNPTDHVDMMQVYDPPVVYSSFRPVSPSFTHHKKPPPSPIQTLTPLADNVEAVCAELPKKLQLGKAIWHSSTDSPEDFYDKDYVVDEALCHKCIDSEGDIPTPSWSPLSPFFPKHIPPASDVFSTPQLVSTDQAISEHEIATQSLYNAWLGTSVLTDAEWTELPSKTLLDDAISRRAAAETAAYRSPYDPECWLRLTNIYFELCFNDIQVASAHKALYLVNQGLDLKDRHVGQKVREAVGMRLGCPLHFVIVDELEHGRIEGHKALLRGLLEMSAYWDGLKEAKRALDIFPGHEDILLLQRILKSEFHMRATALQESKQPKEDVKYLSRIGRTYKRQYPWLEEKLFIRTLAFLAEANTNFNSANCEVRPFVSAEVRADPEKPRRSQRLASKTSMQHIASSTADKEFNVGPLGVFARRTIHKDEILLTDYNVSVVPIIPSKKLLHCDACHALLVPPFLPDGELRRPTCCRDVAYCSIKCAETALNGYHKVLCGQDFKWLHKSATSKELDPSWQPNALLRILAIVVADLKSDPNGKMHPLQHPLLARLTAGYESNAQEAKEQVWNYFSHVIAPTRILAQLGVDIFADPRWSAEVIHCVYWRIINNACRSSSCTVVNGKLERVVLSGIGPGYIFFNHSCDAGVAWMAAGSCEGAARMGAAGGSALGKRRRDGAGEREGKEVAVRVGCNALLCVATREIKKGEEARISYLPPGKRQQLGRWFEGGKCVCEVCNGEGTT